MRYDVFSHGGKFDWLLVRVHTPEGPDGKRKRLDLPFNLVTRTFYPGRKLNQLREMYPGAEDEIRPLAVEMGHNLGKIVMHEEDWE